MTLHQFQQFFTNEIRAQYGPAEARELFYILWQHYSGQPRLETLTARESEIEEPLRQKLMASAMDLREGRPYQYIMGQMPFLDLEIKVGPEALIPRPETEEMADRVIRELRQKPPERILDLGTGTGCLALALKAAFPSAQVTGLELSEKALNLARQNALHNQLEVEWVRGNILEDAVDLPGPWDLWVSNPPYIPRGERPGLESRVRDYEPEMALFVPDEDPLIFFRQILKLAESHLCRGGFLYAEIHAPLAGAMAGLGQTEVWQNFDILPDMTGQPRFLRAQRA